MKICSEKQLEGAIEMLGIVGSVHITHFVAHLLSYRSSVQSVFTSEPLVCVAIHQTLYGRHTS